MWEKNELSVDYTHYVYTKVHIQIIACYAEYLQSQATAAKNGGFDYFHYVIINDLHSAGLNTINAAQMVYDRPPVEGLCLRTAKARTRAWPKSIINFTVGIINTTKFNSSFFVVDFVGLPWYRVFALDRPTNTPPPLRRFCNFQILQNLPAEIHFVLPHCLSTNHT